MKNRENFAKEILDIACSGDSLALDAKGSIVSCEYIECLECLFNRNYDSNCKERVKKWCESEYIEKPKISESDRRFLDYIPKSFKYIIRDSRGNLYAYVSKPYKSINDWCDFPNNAKRISMMNYKVSFPMVKWEDEEPWLIEDLKKLEVEP